MYLVGAGPGAPDLLTVRAARLLGEAEIVFHDALIHPDTLALAPHAEKIPVGKRCGRHSTAQRFINKRLADAARRYRVVVRLKGGDPMIFGRAHEEIAFLKRNSIKVEVVPGITAALAASAQLQVPLTRRGLSRSVVFATTRSAPGEAPSDWARAVAAADTAVLYMSAGDAGEVARKLKDAGVRATLPVALAQNVSLARSAVLAGTLEELPQLAAARGGGAALIILGEVCGELGASAARAMTSLTQARG